MIIKNGACSIWFNGIFFTTNFMQPLFYIGIIIPLYSWKHENHKNMKSYYLVLTNGNCDRKTRYAPFKNQMSSIKLKIQFSIWDLQSYENIVEHVISLRFIYTEETKFRYWFFIQLITFNFSNVVCRVMEPHSSNLSASLRIF